MDKKELCKKVDKCTRHILLASNKQVVSMGTGVTINRKGVVVTANHVISDGEEGFIDGTILVRTDDGLKPHRPILSDNLSFHIDYQGINSIKPDINLLTPISTISDQNYLPLCNSIPEIGTDVIIAGYPDEINFEFHPDKMIDHDRWKIDHIPRLQKEIISKSFAPLMLKSGMIGNVQPLYASNVDLSKVGIDNKMDMKAAYYAVDNSLTKGGSGGPVVNFDGELLGVIVERTRAKSDIPLVPLLPSGTGIGISHLFVTWVLPHLGYS